MYLEHWSAFRNPFLQFGWFHFRHRRDNNLPLVKSCMNHSNCALALCANPSAASIFAFPHTHLRSASPRSHKEAAAVDLHPSPWAHQHNLISSRRAPRVTFENHSHNSYPPGSVDDGNILGKTGKFCGRILSPWEKSNGTLRSRSEQKKKLSSNAFCVMRNPTRVRGGFKNAGAFWINDEQLAL